MGESVSIEALVAVDSFLFNLKDFFLTLFCLLFFFDLSALLLLLLFFVVVVLECSSSSDTHIRRRDGKANKL